MMAVQPCKQHRPADMHPYRVKNRRSNSISDAEIHLDISQDSRRPHKSMMPKKNGAIGHNNHGFPRLEVIILVLCVTVNWYTLANLFPYVGIMVMQFLGLESIDEAGFYAGYVTAAFMFGRFLSGYAIGYVSDKVGRKPVLMLSLLTMAIFSLAFGFSESFSWAIGARLLLGMTNGILITARTSLRELCGREHVVMGMVYMSGSWPMGLITGTGVGGLLAIPSLHYPTVFSPTGLFGRYPFLLPNLLGALFAALALPLVLFCYPETKGLDERRGDGEFKRLTTEGTVDDQTKVTDGGSFGDGAGDNGTTSFKGDVEQGKIGFCEWRDGMQSRIILRLHFLGCTVQMILVGFDDVFPLWMLSTPGVGGLGWNTEEIGKLVLTTGIIFGIIQFAVLPRIVRLVGIVTWYRAAWVLTVVAFLLIPNAKTLSWNSSSLFAMGIIGNLLFQCCSSGIFVALAVATTNSFAPQHRGKLSGLNNTAENVGCFIGPVGSSTIYALSIARLARGGEAEDGSGISWLDYHFVFYASAVMLALLAGVGWRTLTSEVLEKPTAEESQ